MSTQVPPFGGANTGWGPPPTGAPQPAWSPPVARLIAAHAVMWIALLVLLLSSGPWSRAISKALFESGGYSRWALAAADAVVYSLLTLPLAVAIVLVGRSVGRVAAALALVLLGVALGATPAASVISSHNARIAIAVLMSMALAAAWICARRRNPLGLLAVLVAGLLALVISVAGDSLLSGDDVLGVKWGALAVLPLIVAAWAAVGIDAATAPRGSRAAGTAAPPNYVGAAPGAQHPWQPS